jgi:hypothetical protein
VPRPYVRVQAIPKLHSASTTAWGLVRWGMVLDTHVVYCDNCSERVISVLRRMGVWMYPSYTRSPRRTHREKPTPKSATPTGALRPVDPRMWGQW